MKILDDNDFEGDKSFFIEVVSTSSEVSVAPLSVLILIQDDEGC